MKAPVWLKPGIYGAVIGAIALAVVGFSWGGWTTATGAQRLADVTARQQVVAALVPICLEQSRVDPVGSATLTQLREASAYKRGTLLMAAGWATMPGAAEPNRAVANACMERLAAEF